MSSRVQWVNLNTLLCFWTPLYRSDQYMLSVARKCAMVKVGEEAKNWTTGGDVRILNCHWWVSMPFEEERNESLPRDHVIQHIVFFYFTASSLLNSVYLIAYFLNTWHQIFLTSNWTIAVVFCWTSCHLFSSILISLNPLQLPFLAIRCPGNMTNRNWSSKLYQSAFSLHFRIHNYGHINQGNQRKYGSILLLSKLLDVVPCWSRSIFIV